MGKTEKQLQTIMNNLVILMIHVIKIVVENRTTNSWVGSIYSSLCKIKKANQRENNSYRFTEFQELIDLTYEDAINVPARECFNGLYQGDEEAFDLAIKDQIDSIKLLTLQIVLLVYNKNPLSQDKVTTLINDFMGFE